MSALLLCFFCWPGDGAASPAQLYERAVRKTIEQAAELVQRAATLWEDHSTWDHAWQVRTAHYSVRTTHSRYLANDLAQGLEQMLGHFQRLLATSYAPSEPLAILIFPSLTDYNQFGRQFGQHSSIYGSFYADEQPERAVATYYTSNTTLLRMWVTHSAAHQFIDHALRKHAAPTWIEEGLASYFALYWDYRFGVQELARMKRANQLLPLENLLASPLEQYGTNPDGRFLELAMWFTYMLQFREDTKSVEHDDGSVSAPFADYLRLQLEGKSTRGHPVEQLLERQLNELDEEFRDFDFPA
ncbi:MAG: hypothetical protein U1E76_09420 [Planctomycetota bacterium]